MIEHTPKRVNTYHKAGDPGERGAFYHAKTQNLQDLFLNQTRKDRQSVTLFLMNGFRMRGIVRGFDSFTVVLETDGKQQLIYKHAISTLVLSQSVDMTGGTNT